MTRLSSEQVPEIALAGNATITLHSANTDRHFTYKIIQSKDKEELFFIKLLHGADNEQDYKYVGCYYRDTHYFHPCKTYQQIPKRNWPASLQAVYYLLEHLYDVPDMLHVYHEGKCARCGRKLTTPESILSGFGPECIKFL